MRVAYEPAHLWARKRNVARQVKFQAVCFFKSLKPAKFHAIELGRYRSHRWDSRVFLNYIFLCESDLSKKDAAQNNRYFEVFFLNCIVWKEPVVN